MRTISVAVSEEDYEAFRREARRQHRPIAQLIREAMAHFRAERIPERTRLTELRVFEGARLAEPLPKRWEIWDEMYDARWIDDEE